ncbi:MAG: hypothetical protein GY749_10140 [Desulfobacteraceae bacterium]|nr:hypothetical protein [Desulfobacteraceae bacterium]
MNTRFGTVLLGIALFITLSAQAVHALPREKIRFDKIDTNFQINTFIQDRDLIDFFCRDD